MLAAAGCGRALVRPGDEAQLALRREEQVVRLEVAVDQLVGVQAEHRLQQLRVRVRVRVGVRVRG